MTLQEKLEFIIDNWDSMTIEEIALKIEATESQIKQWVYRIRQERIPLNKKRRIDWGKLKKKYEQLTNK